MSQQPPWPGPPYAGAPYAGAPYAGYAPRPPVPPAPRRPRPSLWWFTVGAGLLVLSVVAFVVLLLGTVHALTGTDRALVTADGTPQQVSVEPGEQLMIWGTRTNRIGLRPDPDGQGLEQDLGGGRHATSCTVVDTGSGRPVRLDPTSGWGRQDEDGVWVGVARFDSGSGRLELTCTDAGDQVQLATSPQVGRFLGGLAATLIVPLVLAGLGVVALLVTTVLVATGGPRRPAASA